MEASLISAKIKVLEVCNQLNTGGTEKTLQLLTTHLNKDFFDVFVCGLQVGGPRAELLSKLGYNVEIINSDFNKFVSYLKKNKIDIVHWHSAGSPEPFVLKAAKQANIPVIIRNNVFGSHDDSAEAQFVDANVFISKMCFLRYKQKNKCNIKTFYKNNKVIYNPIELSVIEQSEPNPSRLNELKNKYGIASNDPVIGRIGRPDDNKFSILSIEMMRYLIRLQPRIKFIILGITESKLKRIHQLGFLKNFIFVEPTIDSQKIYELYYILNIYAHSATWGESFGVAIAEAMACKKPVITHSTPHWDNAQIELVDHGINGFIANNPRLYAQAIDYLLRNPEIAISMGEAGHKKVDKLYDISVIIKQFEKLCIDQLIAKGISLNSSVEDYADSISYRPSLEELVDFDAEYRQRLNNSFGKPKALERIRHAMDESLIYGKSFAHKILGR